MKTRCQRFVGPIFTGSRTLFGLACLVAPTIAAAQPGASLPPDGAGPGFAAATDPWAFHHGITFEANLGVGFAHESVASLTNDSDGALAADLGLGGWINPQLALGVRIAGVQLKDTLGSDVTISGFTVHAFVGPNVQYWPTPNIWVGGGAGLSTERWLDSAPSGSTQTGIYLYCTGDNCRRYGFGFNLRAGYSFGSGGPDAFNVSVETNTGFFSETTVTGISILAGYQYL